MATRNKKIEAPEAIEVNVEQPVNGTTAPVEDKKSELGSAAPRRRGRPPGSKNKHRRRSRLVYSRMTHEDNAGLPVGEEVPGAPLTEEERQALAVITREKATWHSRRAERFIRIGRAIKGQHEWERAGDLIRLAVKVERSV